MGKTVLARTLATSLGAELSRVQGHPDLLPVRHHGRVGLHARHRDAGISGPAPSSPTWCWWTSSTARRPARSRRCSRRWRSARSAWTASPGRLPQPHLVIATQNPHSQRGTFPLVESQLDRFAMATAIGYPDAAQEVRLALHGGGTYALADLRAGLHARGVGARPAGHRVRRRCTRPWPPTRWSSAGPAGRHPACISAPAPVPPSGSSAPPRRTPCSTGRPYVVPDDVKAVAVACLSHRILTVEADAGAEPSRPR